MWLRSDLIAWGRENEDTYYPPTAPPEPATIKLLESLTTAQLDEVIADSATPSWARPLATEIRRRRA